MIEGVEIEVWHEFCFHVLYCFVERLDELVEILLVEKDLMAVVSFICKSLPAFGDGEVVVITPGCSDIKEIGSTFTCAYAFAIHAVHSFVVVFV